MIVFQDTDFGLHICGQNLYLVIELAQVKAQADGVNLALMNVLAPGTRATLTDPMPVEAAQRLLTALFAKIQHDIEDRRLGDIVISIPQMIVEAVEALGTSAL